MSSEDRTRAVHTDGARPTHGRVGPADPHADPVTSPGLAPMGDPATDPGFTPVRGAGDPQTVPTDTKKKQKPARSRSGGFYGGLIFSALVLLVLLIFILENLDPVRIEFLWLEGTLPVGVALLFAAIAGLLLAAIPAGLRIMQLRRAARRGES